MCALLGPWRIPLLYSHIINMLIYTCIYMQNESQRHIDKGRAKTSFRKICTSHFIVRFERVINGFTVRGSWIPNRNCNILTALLWPSALCLSRSPDAQPEARVLTLLAFSTTSHQQLLWTPTQSGVPRAPSAGSGFPYHILSATLDPNSIFGMACLIVIKRK